MSNHMNLKDARLANKIIEKVIEDNPLGAYHRMEDIYEDASFMAYTRAANETRARGEKWVGAYDDETESKWLPYMPEYYMETIDDDRIELVKKLKTADIKDEKLLKSFEKGLEEITELKEHKELLDECAKNAFLKCAFNVFLYEFLK